MPPGPNPSSRLTHLSRKAAAAWGVGPDFTTCPLCAWQFRPAHPFVASLAVIAHYQDEHPDEDPPPIAY